MVVALVAQGAGVEGGLGVGQGDIWQGDVRRLLRPARGQGDGHLQSVQGHPPVPVGPVHKVVEGVVVGGGALGVESPAEQDADGVGRQGIEPEQTRPGQQGGVDLEVRVLGGGADEDQQAVLDVGQEGVLLGLVEAVDLVEEQDRAGALLAQAGPGPGHDLTDVLHPGRHRRQGLERLGRHPGDEAGKGGLARPRRAPEDHRRQPVGLDQLAQRAVGAEEVLLADHVVEGAGRRRAASGA